MAKWDRTRKSRQSQNRSKSKLLKGKGMKPHVSSPPSLRHTEEEDSGLGDSSVDGDHAISQDHFMSRMLSTHINNANLHNSSTNLHNNSSSFHNSSNNLHNISANFQNSSMHNSNSYETCNVPITDHSTGMAKELNSNTFSHNREESQHIIPFKMGGAKTHGRNDHHSVDIVSVLARPAMAAGMDRRRRSSNISEDSLFSSSCTAFSDNNSNFSTIENDNEVRTEFGFKNTLTIDNSLSNPLKTRQINHSSLSVDASEVPMGTQRDIPVAKAGNYNVRKTTPRTSSFPRYSSKRVATKVGSKKNRIGRSSGILQTFTPSKLLRLDIDEEANELPDTPEMRGPQIVSFRNVPDLLGQSKESIAKLLTPQAVNAIDIKLTNLNQPTDSKRISHKAHYRKVSSEGVLDGAFPSLSSDGSCELVLISQPELQHRARYQTEGSRGAVKDRDGSGHPVIKILGYDKACILQVFVVSCDLSPQKGHGSQPMDYVTPHVFYQACRVSGKNSVSTPCTEERVEGTAILKVDLHPDKNMSVCCDCIGILKERNVDVELRLKSIVTKTRKKSTKCRLAFRVQVTLDDGQRETLQVVSQPISCTQPPGVPEVQRQSLKSCPAQGGVELFLLGKNFLKDTQVIFKYSQGGHVVWKEAVKPDKECMQTTSLVCIVPPFYDVQIQEEVHVQVLVESCGKASESQTLRYLPLPAPSGNYQESILHRNLPKGVSPNAVHINNMFAESGQIIFPSKPMTESKTTATQTMADTEMREVNIERPTMVRETYNEGNGVNSLNFCTAIPDYSVPGCSDHTRNISASYVKSEGLIQKRSNSLKENIVQLEQNCSAPQYITHDGNSMDNLSVKMQESGTAVHNVENFKGKSFTQDESKNVSPEIVLPKLINMLRLVKTLPNTIHGSMVDLIADEIHNQLKSKSSFVDLLSAPFDKQNKCQSEVHNPPLSQCSSNVIPQEQKHLNLTQNGHNLEETMTVRPNSVVSPTVAKFQPLNVRNTAPNSVPLAVITPSLRFAGSQTIDKDVYIGETAPQNMARKIIAVQQINTNNNAGYTTNNSFQTDSAQVPPNTMNAHGESSYEYSSNNLFNVKVKNETTNMGRLDFHLQSVIGSSENISTPEYPSITPTIRKDDQPLSLNNQATVVLHSNNTVLSNQQMNNTNTNMHYQKTSDSNQSHILIATPHVAKTNAYVPMNVVSESQSIAKVQQPSVTLEPNIAIQNNVNSNTYFQQEPYQSNSIAAISTQCHQQSVSTISDSYNQSSATSMVTVTGSVGIQSSSGITRMDTNESLSTSLTSTNSQTVHHQTDPLLSSLSTSQLNSQPAKTFFEGTTIERSISQLSETELLDYINPNCFDNV